jgi:hypothetical protein
LRKVAARRLLTTSVHASTQLWWPFGAVEMLTLFYHLAKTSGWPQKILKSDF